MPILAPMPVIDPVAVADVEALLAAITPDRVLHEPRKYLWEAAVELPSIDVLGNQANDIGTAAWPVTAGTVKMGGLEPGQDPGSVQEIVDQGIDRNQLQPDFEPPRANVGGADQNAGQRHGEHLVRHAVNIAQRINQGIACLRQRVRSGLVVRLVQAVIDPADQVALGNVANEQVQAVGNLIEVAISQAMCWQRAGGNVVRFGARAACLLVSAGMKMPIGFQLRATWSFSRDSFGPRARSAWPCRRM